jgi:hypothetical protein
MNPWLLLLLIPMIVVGLALCIRLMNAPQQHTRKSPEVDWIALGFGKAQLLQEILAKQSDLIHKVDGLVDTFQSQRDQAAKEAANQLRTELNDLIIREVDKGGFWDGFKSDVPDLLEATRVIIEDQYRGFLGESISQLSKKLNQILDESFNPGSIETDRTALLDPLAPSASGINATLGTAAAVSAGVGASFALGNLGVAAIAGPLSAVLAGAFIAWKSYKTKSDRKAHYREKVFPLVDKLFSGKGWRQKNGVLISSAPAVLKDKAEELRTETIRFIDRECKGLERRVEANFQVLKVEAARQNLDVFSLSDPLVLRGHLLQ